MQFRTDSRAVAAAGPAAGPSPRLLAGAMAESARMTALFPRFAEEPAAPALAASLALVRLVHARRLAACGVCVAAAAAAAAAAFVAAAAVAAAVARGGPEADGDAGGGAWRRVLLAGIAFVVVQLLMAGAWCLSLRGRLRSLPPLLRGARELWTPAVLAAAPLGGAAAAALASAAAPWLPACCVRDAAVVGALAAAASALHGVWSGVRVRSRACVRGGRGGGGTRSYAVGHGCGAPRRAAAAVGAAARCGPAGVRLARGRVRGRGGGRGARVARARRGGT